MNACAGRMEPSRIRPSGLVGTLFLLAVWLWCGAALADPVTLRVGLVKFGSAAWEIATARQGGLDKTAGLDLQIVDLANPEAGKIALLAGGVDMIVTDWLWTSRMRDEGRSISFLPYSGSVGAVMTGPGTRIVKPSDLKGRHLGVAGGPLDKSWIMFKAYARTTLGFDPEKDMTVDFAAPPLLNQQLQSGQLDAVLTFWNYAARLRAAGMPTVITVDAVASALGLDREPAWLGWVYDDAWTRANPGAVQRFAAMSLAVKQRLAADDAAWVPLKPQMGAANDREFAELLAGFRAGIPAVLRPIDWPGLDGMARLLTGKPVNRAAFPAP